MALSYNPNSYHPSDFDADFCLKPPLLLWAAILYLARAIVLLIVVGIGNFANVNADAMTMMHGVWRPETLVPALVALPVLCALFRRVAGASRFVRWIWAHGRAFLAVAAVLDIALTLMRTIPFQDVDEAVFLGLCAAGADVYVLLYVLAARRVRDTFSDFPPPLEKAK